MSLLDTTMEVAKLAGKIANPELVQEAMKANAEALAMSRENLELHTKIVELNARVRDLQIQKDLRGQLFVNGGYLYRDRDPNPYCLTCWDATGRLIHMPPLNNDYFMQTCTVCKNDAHEVVVKAPTRDHPGSVPVV